MPTVQNATGRDLNQTFGQLFEGLRKEEQQYDVLKEKLIEYVSSYNEFTVDREERLEKFLDSLDNISDHWEEINQWIEDNSDSLERFTGSIEDVRNIFQDIIALTQNNRSLIAERQRIARNARDLALESESIARRESGITERNVQSLILKTEKIKDQFEFQTKILTGGSLEEETIQAARERVQGLIDNTLTGIKAVESREKQLTNQLATARGVDREKIRAQIREQQLYGKELQEELRLRVQSLEYLSDYNKKAVEGLVDFAKRKRDVYREERENSKNKTYQTELAAKALRKVGLSTEASILVEDQNKFVSEKVEARERREASQRKLTGAQKILEKQQADVIGAGLEVPSEADLSSRVESSLEAYKAVQKELGDNQAVLDGKLQDSVDKAREAIQGLQQQLRVVQDTGQLRNEKGQYVSNAYKEGVVSDLENQIAEKQKELQAQENILRAAIGRQEALEGSLAKAEKEYRLLAGLQQKQANYNDALLEKNVVEKETEGILNKNYNVTTLIGENLKSWLSPLKIASVLAGAIFTNFLKINGETAHVKQLVGEWTMGYARANWGQATILETTKLIGELTEKMGANPITIFSSREMGQISEAKKLLGLTADQAAGLGVQAKLNGVYANEYREFLQKGIGAGQILNRTVVSQGVATREALAASDAIKISMGNNAEQIGKAVVAAKALGMTLQEVEGISRNLINFESSIQAEMQAQLLTGNQLNLAKARELALNNNLEGVAKEIGRQGITVNEYGRMNLIQQENLAKALGMSRDQMAKMLVTQALSEGLTARQIAQAGLMNEKQIEAVSLQENWKTMLGNVVGMLTPILQLLNPVVELVSKLVGLAAGLFGYLLEPLDRLSTHLSSVIGKWEGWGGIVRKTNEEGIDMLQWIGSGLVLASLLVFGFRRIIRPVLGVTRGILSWIPALGKAGAAAKLTETSLGRTRDRIQTPRGPGRVGRAFSSLGKNLGKIIAGAVAMGIMSLALIGFAKAVQMMPTGKEGWNSLAKVAVALVALGAIAALASLVAPELIVGALALTVSVGLLSIAMLALRDVVTAYEGVDFTGMFKGFPGAMLRLALGATAATVAAIPLTVGSTALFAASVPLKKALQNLASTPGSALTETATGITLVAQAVEKLSASLSKVSLAKLGALGLGLQRLKGSQILTEAPRESRVEIPEESSKDKQGITEEHVGKAVEELTIKQAKVQASAQEISVEQKATDLGRIESKMDAVIKAIKDAAPTSWDWVKFGQEFGKSVPFASR